MFDFDNDADATEFDPSPWGSRQRVIPRAEFRAVAPNRTPPPIQSLVARVAQQSAAAPLVPPVVREADIPTWRVPKLEYEPSPSLMASQAPKPRKRRFLDLRRLLPIVGPASIAIIALVGTRVGVTAVRADATSISASLLTESSETRIQNVNNVEEPPALQAVAPPHAVTAPAKVKHASMSSRVTYTPNHPHLSVDYSTPLGDLVKKHRR